jgi:Tat protein translocase TatB subunit
MFGIGMPELLLILAVALIILGPRKLPEIAKSLGKAMGEFKRATNDLKHTIEHEAGLNDVSESLRETQYDLKRTFQGEDNHPAAAPMQTEVKESAPGGGDPVEPGQAAAEQTSIAGGADKHGDPKENGAI